MDEQQNIIIYRTSDGRASVALYAKDGNIGVMNKSGEIIVSPIHTDIRNARTSYVSYKRIVNTQGFIGQENINTE